MSNPYQQPPGVCPHCGAGVTLEAPKCWLCYAPLTGEKEIITAELVKPAKRPAPLSEGFFLLLTLGCLVLIVMVGMGIVQDAPGLLIPYLVLLAPAILATVSRSLLAMQRGERVTAMQVFLTFLVSASATVLGVVVLFFAAFVALFAYCLYAFGTMSGH